MSSKSIKYIATTAIILALFVVMLGAYTRLTDAGLGCPDWPGCYGHLVLPNVDHDLVAAQRHFPDVPIESRKAWTEMAHRYAAGTLGVLILAIAISVWRGRFQGKPLPWVLPLTLVLLVVFQAALGMWTVTLKLLPVVVMSHLLGGILIFSILCYLRLQLNPVVAQYHPRWRPWIMLGIVIVFCQIALGGWVSSNYAGVACVGFPACNGTWFPDLHFSKGFNLLSPVGANYQGGVLDNNVRVTIQFIHRIGALIAATYVFILSALLFCRVKDVALRRAVVLAAILVVIQCALGIANVVYLLPLPVAVLHNGVAALLLATLFMLHYLSTGGVAHARSH